MKVYSGVRTPDGCRVSVADELGPRDLAMRNDVRNHSPDGAEWGYSGSGPAQLSLAILCDALGDTGRAERVYQRFKARVIAAITTDRWTLTGEEVREAVAALERGCHA